MLCKFTNPQDIITTSSNMSIAFVSTHAFGAVSLNSVTRPIALSTCIRRAAIRVVSMTSSFVLALHAMHLYIGCNIFKTSVGHDCSTFWHQLQNFAIFKNVCVSSSTTVTARHKINQSIWSYRY